MLALMVLVYCLSACTQVPSPTPVIMRTPSPEPLPSSTPIPSSTESIQQYIQTPSPTPSLPASPTGWLLGKNDPDPASATQLYKTTDGGETWSQIAADCPLPLGSEFQFVDEQTGYASPAPVLDFYRDFDVRVNQTPLLFSTRDGGHTWVSVEPEIAP
jgi:hypothetical protein